MSKNCLFLNFNNKIEIDKPTLIFLFCAFTLKLNHLHVFIDIFYRGGEGIIWLIGGNIMSRRRSSSIDGRWIPREETKEYEIKYTEPERDDNDMLLNEALFD